jgi:hypothetical protein
MNDMIRKWQLIPYSSIIKNINLKLVLVNSEDKLQCSVFNLWNKAKDFNMNISIAKTKIMAFQGKYPHSQ